MSVQDGLSLFYLMRFGSGVAVVTGALVLIYALLVARRREIIAPGSAQPVAGE